MYQTPSSRKKGTLRVDIDLFPLVSILLILLMLQFSSEALNGLRSLPLGEGQNAPRTLTLKIMDEGMDFISDGKDKFQQNIKRLPNGDYDLDRLRLALIEYRKGHQEDNAIGIEPGEKVSFQTMVEIVDVIRSVRRKIPAKVDPLREEQPAPEREEAMNIFLGNLRN